MGQCGGLGGIGHGGLGWLTVSDDTCQGLRCGGGDGGVDADLVVFFVVNHLQAERLEQGGEQARWYAAERVGD